MPACVLRPVQGTLNTVLEAAIGAASVQWARQDMLESEDVPSKDAQRSVLVNWKQLSRLWIHHRCNSLLDCVALACIPAAA